MLVFAGLGSTQFALMRELGQPTLKQPHLNNILMKFLRESYVMILETIFNIVLDTYNVFLEYYH